MPQTDSSRRRPRSLAKYVVFALTLGLVAATLAVVASADNSKVYADGNDSPVACNSNPNENPNADNVEGSVEGDPEASFDVGAGNVVTGVCIKTGQTPHSGPLDNGTYDGAFNPVAPDSDDACYEVEGVGTREVTVTRVGDESPQCQAISHIDVIFAPSNGTTTTTTTTVPKTTTTTTVPKATTTTKPPPPKEVTPPTVVVPAPVSARPVFTG
jgi:hypothetical protein